jgi:O-antigen/teichoic acid export membrane protein
LRRKIVFNLFVYTILPKLSSVLFIFILPFISQNLTLNDYAVYGLLSAYLLLFQFLAILGQNVVLQNSYFEYKNTFHLVWARSFGLMTLAGFLASILLSFVLYFTLYDKFNGYFIVVVISLSIYLTLSPIETVASTFFVLTEQALPYTITSLVSGLIATFVFFIAVGVFKLGFLGWVLMWPTVVLMNYIFYINRLFLKAKIYPKLLSKYRFKRRILKVGLFYMPHQISQMLLTSSDRILLHFFSVPSKQIGLYSQGYVIGSYGMFGVNGYFQAFARRIQENFRNSDKVESRLFLKKLIFISTFSISILLFFASLFSKEFFLFFFRTKELQQAHPVAIIVMCSYMYWSTYTFFTYPLLISGKTKLISMISAISATINILGNILLIPKYGIIATTAMTYVSYVFFGFSTLLIRHNRIYLNSILNLRTLCFLLIFVNIALAFTSFVLRDLYIGYKLSISAIFIAIIGLLYSKKSLLFKLNDTPVL